MTTEATKPAFPQFLSSVGSVALRYLANAKLRAGVTIILMFGCILVGAKLFLHLEPYRQHLFQRLQPPGFHGPDGTFFLLGTDQFGRDVLSRLVFGIRIPLLVALLSAVVGTAIGLAIGLVGGYFGKWVDQFVSLLVDVQISLPFMLVALFVISLFGASITVIVVVFSMLSWPSVARVARGVAIQLRESLFVQACRASGLSHTRVLMRHLLPNALPPVLVVSAVQVGQFVVAESSLGFFGLGVPPPAATWGNMLADGREYIVQAWWLSAMPGLCLILLAAAANLIGEGLREILDPRQDTPEI